MGSTTHNRKTILITLLLLQLLLILLGWAGYQRYASLAVHTDPGIVENQFGGTDWVNWENSSNGVFAKSIHPLVEDNPLLKDAYIRPGDVLRRIDYNEVYDAKSVEDLLLRAAPGTVFIYSIERSSVNAFQPEELQIFVESAVRPLFTHVKARSLWSLLPWMLIPGAFLALSMLVILFPILRQNFRENWPAFVLITLGMAVFTLQIIRHVSLLITTDYTEPSSERLFIFLFLALCVSYAWFFLFRTTPATLRLWVLPPLLSGVVLLWPVWQSVFSRQFWPYQNWVTVAGILYFLVITLAAVVVSIMSKWKNRSRQDRAFHLLSGIYLSFLAVIYGLHFSGQMKSLPGEGFQFLALGAAFIPLVSAAASQLKFGRVSVVLTQSLEYLVFGAAGLMIYFIVHGTMEYLDVRFKYRNLIEFGIILLGLMLMRAVYHTYENRLRRYFVSSQRKKLEAIREFTTRIPSFTSSASLASQVEKELRTYFRTEDIWFWMESEKSPLPNLSVEDLNALFKALEVANGYWSRSHQISALQLDEAMEQKVQSAGLHLAWAIPIREDHYGLLLLGRKGRRVYNLDDAELVQNTLQPTRLTLGVLHLVERERLLLEKNYEANLTALRSQINPHFLFNTLNTISSLIHDAPAQAEAATEKLAFIFRYTLKHSSRAMVTFAEELSLVRTYLEIEQTRFGARLTVEYKIDPTLEQVELPAFAIQTFVENCIKHGIAKIIGKGIVRISLKREGDFAICEVEDNGVGIDLSRIHSSTGLNNVITRLDHLYRTKNLLYFHNTGNGTLVTMKIPIQNG